MSSTSCYPIGYQRASMLAASIIIAQHIYGQKQKESAVLKDAHLPKHDFEVDFERFGIDCRLRVSFAKTEAASWGAWVLTPAVQVFWNASWRDMAQAHASLKLYQEVLDTAMLVQAALDGEQIIDLEEEAYLATAHHNGLKKKDLEVARFLDPAGGS